MKRIFVSIAFVFLISLACIFLISHLSTLISAASAQTPTPIQRDLSVTAMVPPEASSFHFSFAADGSHNLHQNQTTTYTITYGASESARVTTINTIVASFGDDRAPNGAHVVDYVIGSASNAYGDAQPVVDLTNRTITWTPILPAGATDQTVTFQLRTNSNYTGTSDVQIVVLADMSNEFLTFPTQSITKEYTFDPNRIVHGPTATPAPTAPTPTPAQQLLSLRFLDISLTSITQSTAQIAVRTNQPAKQLVRFGTSPQSLSQSVQTLQYATSNLITLNNLKPATIYYFQVVATDANGKTRTSEIYTFMTAQLSSPPELTDTVVVVTSGNTLILSDIPRGGFAPFGVLTTDTSYQLTYTLSHLIPFQDVEVIVRGKDGTLQTIPLFAKEPRVFTAALQTGDAGMYEIFVRLNDSNGNVIEQKIARIHVIPKLQVLEKGTNLPIGDARVFIRYFNPKTNQFEDLNPLRFGKLLNPGFTNTQGELALLLPPGRYSAEATALGYDGQTVTFTLGEDPSQRFPVIYLQKNIFNLTSLLYFLRDWLVDLLNALRDGFLALTNSIRFFNSIAYIVLLSVILVGFHLFSLRTNIRWRDLTPFIVYHLYVTARRDKGAYLTGLITDPDNHPLTLARIEMLDLKTDTVLAHTTSNKAGQFVLHSMSKHEYVKLLVSKEGFAEETHIVPSRSHDTIRIVLTPHKAAQPAIIRGSKQLAGEFFEIVLVLSLLAELFFIFSFGVSRTLPFFALSVLNLLLWIFFQREKKV